MTITAMDLGKWMVGLWKGELRKKWRGKRTLHCLMKRRGALRTIVAARLLIALSLAVVLGCADRDTVNKEDQPAALQEANAALQKAEEALKAANADISFDDIANLDNLRDVLPDPNELATAESQANLESAISGFYEVFDTLQISLDPIELAALEAPAGEIQQIELSTSDLALIHLYLGYAYTLDAIARIQAAGGDLYTIEYDPNAGSGQIYKFTLLKDVRNLTPQQTLALFDDKQKQAVLDMIALLTGGKVNAEGLRPSLNLDIYRRSALYHLAKAAELAKDISPQLVRAMDDLQTTIESKLTVELLAQVESWGYTLEALPPDLAKLVP